MASIFTLTSISLKRLFAMGGPPHHKITSLLTYAVFIAIPCILALIVSGIFALVGHVQVIATPFHVSRGVSTVFLSKCSDYRGLHNVLVEGGNKPSNWTRTRSREQGRRLAIRLVITCHFLIYLAPLSHCTKHDESLLKVCFFFSNIKLFKDLTMISKFMPLINSFMNRLVYVLRIPEIRGAIRELIWCNRPFRRVSDTPLENMRARNRATQASSFARSHGN